MTEETIKEPKNETSEIIKDESKSKDNKFKAHRLLAFIIDCLIASLLLTAGKIGLLLAIAYWLLRDGLDFSFMNKRSIGKNLMKLKVVTTDGSDIDYMTSIKRNWTFAIAYLPALGLGGMIGFIGFILFIVEGVMVLSDGIRIGDKSASTQVVEE